MGYVVPNAYRQRIAQAIMGGNPQLRPAYAALGSGRWDPNTGTLTDPSLNDMGLASPIPGYGSLPVEVTQVGTSVRVVLQVAGGGTLVRVSEIGIFTEDGVPVVLDAFRPVPLEAPLTLQATYTIYPEV